MKEIKAYEASDGTLFTDQQKCKEYEEEAEFNDWYSKNYLKVYLGDDIELVDLLDYLDKHWDRFKKKLGK